MFARFACMATLLWIIWLYLAIISSASSSFTSSTFHSFFEVGLSESSLHVLVVVSLAIFVSSLAFSLVDHAASSDGHSSSTARLVTCVGP